MRSVRGRPPPSCTSPDALPESVGSFARRGAGSAPDAKATTLPRSGTSAWALPESPAPKPVSFSSGAEAVSRSPSESCTFEAVRSPTTASAVTSPAAFSESGGRPGKTEMSVRVASFTACSTEGAEELQSTSAVASMPPRAMPRVAEIDSAWTAPLVRSARGRNPAPAVTSMANAGSSLPTPAARPLTPAPRSVSSAAPTQDAASPPCTSASASKTAPAVPAPSSDSTGSLASSGSALTMPMTRPTSTAPQPRTAAAPARDTLACSEAPGSSTPAEPEASRPPSASGPSRSVPVSRSVPATGSESLPVIALSPVAPPAA